MLITTYDAAKLVNVSERTIYRYTYPDYTGKKPARLTRTAGEYYWYVDTQELKYQFVDHWNTIDRAEDEMKDTTVLCLKAMLDKAVANEDYEQAATIKKTISLVHSQTYNRI